MKESYYNHYVSKGEITLFYNSYMDAYLVVKKKLFDTIFINGELNVQRIRRNYPETYQVFVENGFIVEDTIDEVSIVESRYYDYRFSTEIYELIINPTLDCNLRCWYCYESHVPKSQMTKETIDRIIKNIKRKYEKEPFKVLRLSFFGGEPMLKPQVIYRMVEEVKSLSADFGFKIKIHFTTNGVVITDRLLIMSNDCDMTFQITFDGGRKQHNAIRVKKLYLTMQTPMNT